jgi:hypothetical protein
LLAVLDALQNATLMAPSTAQLKDALKSAEIIESLQNEFAPLIGGGLIPAAPGAGSRGRKKGGISAAGRARIAAKQRVRWAKIK